MDPLAPTAGVLPRLGLALLLVALAWAAAFWAMA
jgi:hypothetical protein